MLQVCFRDDTGFLQGFYRGLQRSYRVVTGLLQGYYKGIKSVLKLYYFF